MNADNEGHVLIVTGAGGGLGSAIARGLLAAGRRIVAVDIDAGAAGLAALAAGAQTSGSADRLLTTTGNVRESGDCEAVVARTIDRFGELQGVVNVAGLGPYRRDDGSQPPFFEVPPAYWQALIDTNVNGPFLMTRAVAPHLLANGWGRIVNVTTSLFTMVMKGMAPYGSSKAALESGTAIWAKDLDGTGVSANVLVPGGAADTAMVPYNAEPDRSKLISPAVMVPPIVWLTSHAADGTTGKRIVAKEWTEGAPLEANLRASMAPAGWG